MILTDNVVSNEYLFRINKVFDYIEANLSKSFTLEELAEVANFSKYHFNRIFSSMVGESPFKFILRIRLERAAFMLKSNKNATVSDIAMKCGFAELSVFSRNFKGYFKISPTEYRKQSLVNQIDLTNGLSSYFCFDSKTIKLKNAIKQNKGVEIKDLPKMSLAYVRYMGAYIGEEKLIKSLWDKLFIWPGNGCLVSGYL